METNSTPAADPALLLARRACYRFVALALADPQTGAGGELAEPESQDLLVQAAEILRGEERAVARPLAVGERPLADLDPRAALKRLPRTANEGNCLYESTFGLLGGSKCPPYETEYVPSKQVFQRSNRLADIAGYYRAFGLQCSTSHPDRPDHVVRECEFMGQVLQLEWLALQRTTADAAEQAETCRRAARRFLEEHIVWWFPALGKLLAHQVPGGFYESVGQFLAALVAAERSLAGIPVREHFAEPSPIEVPDACTGCEMVM